MHVHAHAIKISRADFAICGKKSCSPYVRALLTDEFLVSLSEHSPFDDIGALCTSRNRPTSFCTKKEKESKRTGAREEQPNQRTFGNVGIELEGNLGEIDLDVWELLLQAFQQVVRPRPRQSDEDLLTEALGLRSAAHGHRIEFGRCETPTPELYEAIVGDGRLGMLTCGVGAIG